MKIKRIEPLQPIVPVQKKVAAYARVSVSTEQLMHSLSAQISYYSELIQRTPGWEYAGVYADAGITGTDAKVRPKFQQLIADCEAGKIDIILTKSISRFARNTVDLLSTVRHLKGLGVEVRFEKENVSTASADGEVMLSILASFAEQESISLSQNLKWSVRKRYEQGKVHAHLKLYGYRWEGDERVIVPEEAEVVKFIFAEYLAGRSFREIATDLDAKGVKGVYNKEHFSDQAVRRMISNEEYTGCQILQRSYAHKPRKVKMNKGELPMYRIEDHHEAIIEKEIFDAAQHMREERGKLNLHERRNYSPWSGMIRCGECGGRVDMHSTGKRPWRYWICSNRNDTCFNKNTNDESMQEAVESVFGKELTAKELKREVRQILMFRDRIEIQMQNGRKITWQKQ